MTIEGLLKKVKTVDLKTAVPAIIKKTDYGIIALNQNQLFKTGSDSKGNKLRKYRDKYYAEYKNRRNPLPGLNVPDLKNSGEFYKGFSVTLKQKTFSVSSTDDKSPGLQKKYGRFIFGLHKDSMKEYTFTIFYPDLKKYITKKTGLIFK